HLGKARADTIARSDAEGEIGGGPDSLPVVSEKSLGDEFARPLIVLLVPHHCVHGHDDVDSLGYAEILPDCRLPDASPTGESDHRRIDSKRLREDRV
ncbi:hypothetical protein PMAYCL1PPCAC_15803, partial [Pristionchus mayeri]